MKAANSRAWYRFSLLLLGLYAAYTLYCGILNPPAFGYYTRDEDFVADGGVFMWYGNTPRCLDWPASPSVLLFFVIFGISSAFSVVSNLSNFNSIFDALEHFDKHTFEYLSNRADYILAGRAIQLAIVVWLLFRITKLVFDSRMMVVSRPWLRIILTVTLITSYLVWFNGPVLRPEAFAGVAFALLVAQVLFSESFSRKQAFWIAALFGVIVAQRLIFLFVFPMVWYALFFRVETKKWQTCLQGLGVFLVAFLVFCPFIFTDPLVVLKAFGGGILAKMQDAPMATLFNQNYIGEYFSNPVSYLIILLSIAGGIQLIRLYKSLGWVVVANTLFFLFLVLRSSKIYDTHVLPAGVITLFLLSFGIEGLVKLLPKYSPAVMATVLTIIAISSGIQVWKFQRRAHTAGAFEAALNWVKSQPDSTRYAAPPGFDFELPRNRELLKLVMEESSNPRKMASKIDFLLGKKLSANKTLENYPLISKTFLFEDERLYNTIFSLQYKFNHLYPKTYWYEIYIDNSILANTYISTDAALQKFGEGKYDYLFSWDPVSGRTPYKEFRDEGGVVFLYKYAR